MKNKIDSYLTNKFVLIFIFFVAIGNLIVYAMARNIFAIIVFCLIGFVISFFSKNMIVILLMPIVFTAIITGFYTHVDHIKEGFDEYVEGLEDMTEEEEGDKEEHMEDMTEEEEEEEEKEETGKKMKEFKKPTPTHEIVSTYKDTMNKISKMGDYDSKDLNKLITKLSDTIIEFDE
jgi:uncharacterized protein YxeA